MTRLTLLQEVQSQYLVAINQHVVPLFAGPSVNRPMFERNSCRTFGFCRKTKQNKTKQKQTNL